MASSKSFNFASNVISILAPTALLMSALCTSSAFAQTSAKPAYPHNYAAAQFSDQERQQRVAALIPEIDKLYAELANAEHLPGLSYGIVMDGKLIHTQSLGLANLASKTPVTSSTQFRIASMTKSFATMAIMQLRDQGALKLDDPVSKYLPELRTLALPTNDSPPLSLKNLMTMTTGLPEDNPWGDRQMALDNRSLERFVAHGLSFSNVPGGTYEYSNLGYVLLGKVISKVSKMRFQDYITKNILLPLGMKDTIWEYSKAAPEKLALGYRWRNEQWEAEPILHDGDAAAMGGLITTMDDFARYTAFHLAAWPARNEIDRGPVKRASVREMQQAQIFASFQPQATFIDSTRPNPRFSFYAYGLRTVRDSNNVLVVGHGGGLPGYGSQFFFAPDHGVAVIAFSNLRYGPVYGLTGKALAMLIEKAKLPARSVQAPAILLKRQQQVAELIQHWDLTLGNSIAADNFFLDYSREDRIAESKKHFDSIGKVLSVGAIRAENQLRGNFEIKGENGSLLIAFTLTPEPDPKVQFVSISKVNNP
ncbi:serine hydrolase domain-containing protein [Undibacterium flavidum]|uniref:Beta-lactamase family protein n=1 Tax=Undibacterium flavidum TaxID=2762297 RepID=A0ABR6YGY3_9BURK|nr:serine hydrolase domain-containing protein [Undibacterium flavidum]MBC3875802.1 beta-lactamase family protein [Undibacterium flavidum]